MGTMEQVLIGGLLWLHVDSVGSLLEIGSVAKRSKVCG